LAVVRLFALGGSTPDTYRVTVLSDFIGLRTFKTMLVDLPSRCILQNKNIHITTKILEVILIPCHQQLFRSKETLRFWTYTDAVESMEVFLVAYTCFNLNLEIFVETRSNSQQRCMSILRY
jgi:hypothetical protein